MNNSKIKDKYRDLKIYNKHERIPNIVKYLKKMYE